MSNSATVRNVTETMSITKPLENSILRFYHIYIFLNQNYMLITVGVSAENYTVLAAKTSCKFLPKHGTISLTIFLRISELWHAWHSCLSFREFSPFKELRWTSTKFYNRIIIPRILFVGREVIGLKFLNNSTKNHIPN